MDRKHLEDNKNAHKTARKSDKFAQIVDKPLSPILHKSKYSRKVMLDRKTNRRNIQKEIEKKSEKLLMESETKCIDKRTSAIPVPVKDSPQCEFKKPMPKQSKPQKILSELIEFKNEIINNCAKSSNIPMYKTKFQTGSGKSISISESKIKKYSDIFTDILKTKNKTETDLKVLKLNTEPKQYNTEYKCASGDTSIDTFFENNRNNKNYMEYVQKSGKNHIDLLYENHRFDSVHMSKTTVGFESGESLTVINEVTENVDSPKNNKATKKECADQSITFSQEIERTGITDSQLAKIAKTVENTIISDNNSQLNYNIEADDSQITLKPPTNSKDLDFYQIMSTQEDAYFSNLTQNINTEINKRNKKHSEKHKRTPKIIKNISKEMIIIDMVTKPKDSLNIKFKNEDFLGFTESDYQQSLREYKKHKFIIKNYQKLRKDGCKGFSDDEIKTIVNEYEKYKLQLHEMEQNINNEHQKTKHKKSKSHKLKKDAEVLKNDDLDMPDSKRFKFNAKNVINQESKPILVTQPTGHSIPCIFSPRKPLFCTGKKLKLFARTLTQKINNGVCEIESNNEENCMENDDIQNNDCNSDKNCSIERKASQDNEQISCNDINSQFRIDESTSVKLSQSNRVQICIGNNKIQINIKSNEDNTIKPTLNKLKVSDFDSKCDSVDFRGNESEFASESDYLLHQLESTSDCKNSCGFKTAAGKPIAISENALEKAKALLDECDQTNKLKISSDSAKSSLTNVHKALMMFPTNKILKSSPKNSNLQIKSNESNIFEFGTSKEKINFGFTTASDISIPKTAEDNINFGFTTGSDISLPKTVEEIFEPKESYESAFKCITNNYQQETITCSSMFENESNDPLIIDETIKPINDKLNNNACYARFSVAANNLSEVNEKFDSLDRNSSLNNAMEDLTSGYDSLKNCAINRNSCDLKKPTINIPKSVQTSDLRLCDMGAQTNQSFVGFAKASGQKITISDEALKKAKNMFDESMNESNVSLCPKEIVANSFVGFSRASGKKIDISREALMKAEAMFTNIDTNMEENVTFNDHSLSSAKLIPKESNIGDSLFNDNNFKIPGCAKLEDDFKDLERGSVSKTAHELIEDVVNTVDSALEKYQSVKKAVNIESLIESPVCRPSGSNLRNYQLPKSKIRRRLGISGLKQINIPQDKLEQGRALLEENTNQLITPTKKSLQVFYSTPIKINPINNNTSTPITNRKLNMNFDMTPIKHAPIVTNEVALSPIIFQDNQDFDLKKMHAIFDCEQSALRKRLFIIEERKSVLDQQISIIQNGSTHTRPNLGILTQNKQKCGDRVALKKLFNSGDDNLYYFRVAQYIFDITPKNSCQVHFNIDNNDNLTVLKTLDEAVIIPDLQNIVGIAQLENALKTMPGVDAKLIPIGWVRNHFKWIVWKLASYERKFPQYFNGALSIENIMQQLKYRYDREIDKAERSALRRILEKDDVPQKRLVLCVSDIIQIYNNKFELELSDGWYAVRTIIDQPLMQQIYANKIIIGTKLIVQGADLMNCDGCHPLEVPDNVRLKISFNSSRRAAWHLKLGYYKFAHPFPITLRSINPNGGLISCLKIFIARVYPIRFMEEHNNVRVWRNAKGEDKRCIEFESEQMKQIEAIKYRVICEMENEIKEVSKNRNKNLNFSKVTCAQTLYNCIQNSNDPEKIMAMLSQSQKKSVYDYKQNASMIRQQEITNRISKEISDLNINKRNITPMLKLLIMDAIDKNDKSFIFNIWRPTDDHIQLLKEETSLTVYNISVKKTGELQSTHKTFFKLENLPNQTRKTQRQLLPIAMTVDCYYKPVFNEFDTIGLIVQITINNYDQDLWLSDYVGRLLFVKISEGPTICSLLDHLKRGQIISLSNLTLHNPQNGFGQAIANQYSVISQYPQYKYLQNGLDMFTQQLPQDTNKLLSDCDDKIEKFRLDVDFRKNVSYRNNSLLEQFSNYSDILDDSGDNNGTVIPSRLTMTDVAMSLIDTDQFL